MKIMLLAPNKIHSRRFLHMLLDSGHEIIFVDSHNPIPQGAEHYQFIPNPRLYGLERLGLRAINRWLAPRLKTAQLRRIWQRVKPDIVHVHWVDEIAYLCAHAELHPLILTCWGSDINSLFETHRNDDLRRQRIIYALSRADHITADTSEILERCEIITGKKLPTSLFYYGIDLERFIPNRSLSELISIRDKFNIPADARVVLSIRRLIPMMGHHHILSAFASVVAKTNMNLVLLFHHYLNHDVDYENELRRLADDLRVSKRIIWLDGLTDEQMPALYSLADLIVNFPNYDGFPVSLFEAAACKKAVITNDLQAYREILDHGAFTVVMPGDILQLAKAMENVLETPSKQLVPQLMKNYELIVQVADQHQCIRKIEHVYSSLTKNTGNAQI